MYLIYLSVSPSRTNMKLHNTCVTPKMLKKIITNLDSSKAAGLGCVPVVILKNCEPELQEFFLDCWKVSLVVLAFKNVGERSTAKIYCPISLLSVVTKKFEKL